MKMLEFHSKGDLLVYPPIVQLRVPRYLGRELVGGEFVATGEPYRCPVGSAEAHRMVKVVFRGDVFCADEETAAHFGVQFVKFEMVNGRYVEAVAVEKKVAK